MAPIVFKRDGSVWVESDGFRIRVGDVRPPDLSGPNMPRLWVFESFDGRVEQGKRRDDVRPAIESAFRRKRRELGV